MSVLDVKRLKYTSAEFPKTLLLRFFPWVTFCMVFQKITQALFAWCSWSSLGATTSGLLELFLALSSLLLISCLSTATTCCCWCCLFVCLKANAVILAKVFLTIFELLLLLVVVVVELTAYEEPVSFLGASVGVPMCCCCCLAWRPEVISSRAELSAVAVLAPTTIPFGLERGAEETLCSEEAAVSEFSLFWWWLPVGAAFVLTGACDDDDWSGLAALARGAGLGFVKFVASGA